MLAYSKERGLRRIRPDISFEEYREKVPTAIHIKKVPSLKTLMKWEQDGYCKTPCGCKVEVDGACVHGNPSWLIILKMV